MKVAIYTIALDEARHVDRFLSTAHEADVVVVADTGSTDGTAELLRAGGAVVHQISVLPWRFDVARNTALSLVPDDVDVCVVPDLDEVLTAGWRARLEDEWGDATRGRYRYVWNRLSDGSPGVVFHADKLHARHGYRWRRPCHEMLVPDRIAERVVDLSVEICQWADDSKSRGQYLDLLRLGVEEAPDDASLALYLGREHTFAGQWVEAEAQLRRYLDLPSATWLPERAGAMRWLGDACRHLGRVDEGLQWNRRSCAEAPSLREPWVALAQVAHDRGDWAECYAAACTALAVTERPSIYLAELWAWGERAHDLAGVSAWHLGMRDTALRHAEQAAGLAPSDERIAANLALLRDGVVAGSPTSGANPS